jgi:hypothetical protein
MTGPADFGRLGTALDGDLAATLPARTWGKLTSISSFSRSSRRHVPLGLGMFSEILYLLCRSDYPQAELFRRRRSDVPAPIA